MRRLCIYLVYDRDGIIDRYIAYMLRELKTCADTVVVCNGETVRSGMEYILPYADHVFYRSNLGYDAGGFRDALCRYIGWEKVLEYDALILANDSMFGPFIPMEQIFSEMDRHDFDFWGITKHGEQQKQDCRIYEHIQTYFMVAGTGLLHAQEFREYWEAMPYYSGFNEVVSRHEMVFTHYFSNLGYRYGCFADMVPNDSKNCRNNYMQYGFLQYELIKKRGFPFLKKKPITFDTLDLQTQENWEQALDYIDKHTDYDVDLIWENLIRTVNMADLQRNLHLEFIIPYESGNAGKAESVSVLIIAEHAEAVEYVLEYVLPLDKKLEVQIVSYQEKLIRMYRENHLRAALIEGEELCNYMSRAAEKPYVCLLRDYDLSSDRQPSCTGKSFFYSAWHNLLANYDYICNVMDRFERNPRLGGLASPTADFSEFFGKCSREWERFYPSMEQKVKEMSTGCIMAVDKMPFSVSENVWLRGDILKRALAYHLTEKKYWPYIWTFVAQSMGYYTGIVESDRYASMSGVNRQHYLNQMIRQVRRLYGRTDTFLDLQKNIFKGKLAKFCFAHRVFYIYGTGGKARQFRDLLPNVAGYIVSDGQPRDAQMDGKTVFYLSEIKPEEQIGVVVCMEEKNQRQVIPLLETAGLHYLCI